MQKVNRPVTTNESAATHSLEELIGLVDFILAISSLSSFRDCHRLHCPSAIVVLVLLSFFPVSKTTIELVNESLQLSLSVSVCLYLERQSLAVKDKNNRGHSTASYHDHFTEHILDVLLRLDAC